MLHPYRAEGAITFSITYPLCGCDRSRALREGFLRQKIWGRLNIFCILMVCLADVTLCSDLLIFWDPSRIYIYMPPEEEKKSFAFIVDDT